MSELTLTPVLAGIALSTAVLLLMLIAVAVGAVGRTQRRRVERRRELLSNQIRPLIAAALDAPAASATDAAATGADAAGSDAVGSDAVEFDTAVRRLSRAAGESLDDLVVALVPKLRGGERDRLVAVLQVRGTIDRVARDVRARSSRRRLSAAEFLGAVDDGSHLDALIRLLDDRDLFVRLAAVRALGRIGSPGAVPALMSRLDSPEPGRPLPVHAVTMAVLRCGAGATDALLRALHHGGQVSRVAAAQLFGWLGELSAVPALRHALAHDEAPVRAAAAEALGRLGVSDVGADLVRCLDLRPERLEPPLVRAAAATALGRVGDTRRAADLATVVCVDGDPTVMLAAAQAMGRLGEEGTTALRALAGVSPFAREVLQLRAAEQPQVWAGVLAGKAT